MQRWLIVMACVAVMLTWGSSSWGGESAQEGPEPAAADAEPTSENDARLDLLFKRFPKADRNRDGVLTKSEAMRYYRKLQTKQQVDQNALLTRFPPLKQDVAYGPHERHRLDFWRPYSERATPVLVFFHGGGFINGDKQRINEQLLVEAMKYGFAVVSANYRYATTDPFPASMIDGARVIQFVRSQAEDWNIDPENVFVCGSSAGGAMSLWIGMHDDLADPDSDDPVLRYSSKPQAVGGFGAQSTLNPLEIRDMVGGKVWQHQALLPLFKMESFDEVDDPCRLPLFREASALSMVDPSDPPAFLVYSEPDEPLPDNALPGQGVHHPRFGKEMVKVMQENGLEAVYFHGEENPGVKANESMVLFFKKMLPVPLPDLPYGPTIEGAKQLERLLSRYQNGG